MIVAGIDLSLTSTGVALVTSDGEVELHRIRTSGAADASLTDRQRRLIQIRNRLMQVIADADLVVLEGPAYGVPAQRGRHDLSGLWWLVTAALIHLRKPVAVVPPTTRAKFATDKGNADKISVRSAIRRMWPLVDVRSHDEADGLALATMGAIHQRIEVPFTVLERHHLTIAGVAWPTVKSKGE